MPCKGPWACQEHSSEKAGLGRFSVSLGRMRGFEVAQPSQSRFTPSEGRPGPGLIEAAAPPGQETSVLVWEQEKGLCASPGTVAPPRSPHRGLLFYTGRGPGAPMPSAHCSGLGPGLGPYQTDGQARNSPRALIGSFQSQSIGQLRPIGLSFASSTFDWGPRWGRSIACATERVLSRAVAVHFVSRTLRLWMSPGRV